MWAILHELRRHRLRCGGGDGPSAAESGECNRPPAADPGDVNLGDTAIVPMTWLPAEAAGAANALLTSGLFAHGDLIERVGLDAGSVRVVFRWPRLDRRLYGVRFTVSDTGANTGEPCESAEQWAVEVGWDLAEVMETGLIDHAEQRVEPDDVVLLRWWDGPDWSR